jgi:paraquat-inducible protein B
MSKQSNPALIGTFVLAGVALIVAAVLIFGGSELLANKTRLVTYFPGSVKGLREGSNVVFRGVRLGYVSDIQLVADIRTLETQVAVVMEIVPGAFELTRDGVPIGSESTAGLVSIDDLVAAGFRAQLNTESFVTGQLLVALDFYPDQPAVFRGQNPPYEEVPSIPSNIQQVVEQIQALIVKVQERWDFDKVSADLQSIIDGVNGLVNSPDLNESIAGVNQLVNSPDTQQLASDMRQAIGELRATLDATRQLVSSADTQVDTLAEAILPAVDRLDATLAAAQDALDTASSRLAEDSETGYAVTRTLDEIRSAARALRLFLDYLERNPEALLRGKPKP